MNGSLNRAIMSSDPLMNAADLADRNAFHQYIAGFLSAPLLSPAEEVELGWCLSLARDAMDALAAGDDDPRLREIIMRGSRARHRIIVSNLRLVVSIARGDRGRAAVGARKGPILSQLGYFVLDLAVCSGRDRYGCHLWRPSRVARAWTDRTHNGRRTCCHHRVHASGAYATGAGDPRHAVRARRG